jgi:NADH-quinone oxidoreductase subunit G
MSDAKTTETAETTTEAEEDLVHFTIDGQPCTAKKGETILQAAWRTGTQIPHYCWHPGLSVAGNCRMCLVWVEPGPPKPVIACSTVVQEGMNVEHASERTKQAREGVMEFLLINHPLDCPVCDQAGECDLQQYSFDHGRSESKFIDQKTQRHRKDFGPLIRFVGNRCIACTRCVRFCQEVTGTGELTVVNRSDQAVIDIFPGQPLDNPLSGNTADLCPVGALLEKDSLHSTRVWLHRGTKSVCGGCATGCNINVEAFDDQVKRLTPRENQAVNTWWMCDEGRISHRETQAPERLRESRVRGEDGVNPASTHAALDLAGELIRRAGAGKIAGLVTGYASNEELHFFSQLVGEGPWAVAYRADGEPYVAKDGFTIAADRNPNRAGVKAILGAGDGGEKVIAALAAGDVDVLLVFDGVPGGAPWSEELRAAVTQSEANVITVAMTAGGGLTKKSDVFLPALHWTEKDGTFINARGRLQRCRAAVSPPGDARSDLEVLQELAKAAGLVPRVVSAGGAFRRLAAASPSTFGGIDYNAIGEYGVPLPGAADQTPAEACSTGYESGPKSRSPGRADDEQVRVSIHRESPVGYGTNQGDI